MNTDKELRIQLDRFFLHTLLQILPDLSSEKESDIRKYIARSMPMDISTLNNFLSGRSHSLSADIWPQFPSDKVRTTKKVMGKGARDFINIFNLSAQERYWVLPFRYAMDDKSGAPEFIRNIVSWSIETINGLWGKINENAPEETIDIRYWKKMIELFPWQLLVDGEYFVSLLYDERIVQQMISELEARTTALKNIPREMMGEFVNLEAFITNYNKKSPALKGTSRQLIKELENQETSMMRLKRFADWSGIFRLYSIRTVDIHFYSLLYCLTKEEQLQAKKALKNIHTICAEKGIEPRIPDLA